MFYAMHDGSSSGNRTQPIEAIFRVFEQEPSPPESFADSFLHDARKVSGAIGNSSSQMMSLRDNFAKCLPCMRPSEMLRFEETI